MKPEGLIGKVEKLLEKEPRLIPLPSEGKVVFVGDTHGDQNATEQVTRHYLKKPYRIVFLGDYVDRGNDSQENIHTLLQMKLEHPEKIFLLAGNHEGYMVKELSPANFWESLSPKEKEQYGLLFSKFPLCATSQNGIIALHGVLPDLESLEEMNRIEWGDSHWDRVVWGDFVEEKVEVAGDLWGRPQFGEPYFDRLMEKYQKRILIRSHQPHAPLWMYQKRCVTIFTSKAYLPIRTIVIVDLEREVRTAEDVVVERI
ncbi:MAG: metallophosphoesterase [Thermodesulfobacteriota bacterium]|nr:metallophosphoesterase [Thermodesulfobacteriota bacterium]